MLKNLSHPRPPAVNCFVWDLIRCLAPLEDFSYFVQYRDVPVLGPAFVALSSCIEQVSKLTSTDLLVSQYQEAVFSSLVRRFSDSTCHFREAQAPNPACWQGAGSIEQCPVNTPIAYMAIAAILVLSILYYFCVLIALGPTPVCSEFMAYCSTALSSILPCCAARSS